MRIVFFSRLFYPHIGGVEKHVSEISRFLIRCGHRVVVVTEKYDKNLKTSEEVFGIKVKRILWTRGNWFKKFIIWGWLLKNRKIIFQADIIHFHDVFFWYLPFRFLYPQKRVFTTFHGYEEYPLRRRTILLRKMAETLSTGNICVGDFLKKWYGTKATVITYGGVDLKKYQISNIKYPMANSKKQGAVFIGRLDEQTGIRQYLEAFRIVRKRLPEFVLTVVGDGPERVTVEAHTRVLGFEKNPVQYFAKHRFAFVSRYLSILEALAAKRLVFAAYDNPLKRDYLTMAPFANFIVVEQDSKKLAAKVLYYLKHPEKEKKMVEKGYEWVKKQTWQEAGKLYLKLWKIS